MSTTFDHDSLLGGLNLFKRFDNRFLLDKGERPPYPVMISNPTTTDVVRNLNKADFGIFFGFAVIGTLYKNIMHNYKNKLIFLLNNIYTFLGLPIARRSLKCLPAY